MAQRPADDLYERVKANVRAELVFDFLGLSMKPATSPTAGPQWRGPCPVCRRGGDRILVYTVADKAWCCHSPVCSPKGARKKGGDIVGLVSHVKGIKNSEAAKLLEDTFMREAEKPKSNQRRKGGQKSKASSTAQTPRKPTPSVYSPAEAEEADQWEAFISRL